jgi:exodeoxyribonuclease-3
VTQRLISWNVNGLRACINKGFYDTFAAFDADVFAIQETKLQAGQIELEIPANYHQVWSYAERKGYSGTAVFCKEKPLKVVHTLGLTPADAIALGGSGGESVVNNAAKSSSRKTSSGGPRCVPVTGDPAILDLEGRLCALEFSNYWFVCCYTPNAQDGLARIGMRLAWGAAFTRFVSSLAKAKPVVICGDLNVAHNEIDLKNPKTNRGNAGFSDEEREDFSQLLASGFVDTFRHLYPDVSEAYSWWSFRGNARANNTGWRIDYFLTSDDLAQKGAISEASIYPEVMGSDHCPVGMILDIS